MAVESYILKSVDGRTAVADLQVVKPKMSSEIVAMPLSSDPPPEPKSDTTPNDDSEDDFHPGLRLWIIIVGLGVTLLLTALENTVIIIAIPMINSELGLGENYIWVSNAFFISGAAVQPLIGQLCNVFGRRWNMLGSVAIFTLGSGLCGGATTAGMMIAGRTIQGLGSGGISLLNDIILSDLVPLRLRGNYLGVILTIYGIGTTLGPFIGGSIIATTTWRWVFYFNLPLGGVSLIMLFFFLQVNYNDHMTFTQKVRRIDFLGNATLIASTVAVLYALAYAGANYSWASWHILAPFFLGFLGFFIFGYTQGGRFAAAEPLMPPRLFKHRTSVIISINTFISSGLTFWCIFFLPVFFQAVKLYGPQYTGVALLPVSLVAIPGSAIAAVAISRWGRYKPVHVFGFVVSTLGVGLFTLQNPDTTVAQWASYQCVAALGGGVLLNAQLPAFQAAVSEKDQAAASAAWGFIRSIGWVWGVAIPASVFNNQISQLLSEISDPAAAEILSSGGAYGAASAAQIQEFPPAIQAEMVSVYSQALQRAFQVSIAFAGVGFVLSLFVDEIALRERLDTEYGLRHENDRYSRARAGEHAEKQRADEGNSP